MKKIILALAFAMCAYSAQAWNWVYDQAVWLLAYENLTPEAQSVVKSYLGENIRNEVQTFDKARKGGKLLESADWYTIWLDADMKPVLKDGKCAISQIEMALEVLRNRASTSDEEVKLALHKVIELTIAMHNVGNVRLEASPLSLQDFSISQSLGGYGKREKFRARKWRHFWSYGFAVFHTAWSPEMHIRDLKVCQGRHKDTYMAGDLRSWATDMGNLVKPLYDWAEPDCKLSRQAHAEYEELFLAGVGRASFRIAALLNGALK